MNQTMSLYLDALRFTAAFLVFLSHARLERFNGEWLGMLGAYGRDAVTIFFVLSGFVICHVVTTKERDARSYTLSRLSRLYSVVLPALLLTVTLDYSGRALSPESYAGGWFMDRFPAARFVVSLLLANEWWFESIRPFSNGPFWSLSYEAAYYALFGGWAFLHGQRRVAFLLTVAVLVGPKILLLMPVWLLGVATYRVLGRVRLPAALGWFLFVGSIAAFLGFVHGNYAKALMLLTQDVVGAYFVEEQLKYSRFFLGAYLVGLLVAVNFLGFSAIASAVAPLLERFARPIRYFAGFTFSLYLFHYPLLQFFSCITSNGPLNVCATFAVVLVVGSFTEKRKHVFHAVFSRVFALTASVSRIRPLPGRRA